MTRPRLKRHYSLVAHGPDVVELRHGTWNAVSFTLSDESGQGRLLRVLRCLDGTRTPRQIASTEAIPKRDVEAVVQQLEELDLLETSSSHALDYYLDEIVPNLMPYARGNGRPVPVPILVGDQPLVDRIASILCAGPLAAEASDLVAPESFRRLLSGDITRGLEDGLEFERAAAAFEPWRGRFVVFATATVDPIALRAFNRVALHHRIPWIHGAVDGPFLLVGPTTTPFRSPCFECLETRVLMNLREGASYQRYKTALAESRVQGAAGALDPVLEAMLASHVAFDVTNFLLTGTAFTAGKLLAIYLPTMEFTFNEVLRVPGCPACGSLPERDDRELYFDLRATFGTTELQRDTADT